MGRTADPWMGSGPVFVGLPSSHVIRDKVMFFEKFRYLLEAIFLGLRLRKKSSFALRIFKIKIHFNLFDSKRATICFSFMDSNSESINRKPSSYAARFYRVYTRI